MAKNILLVDDDMYIRDLYTEVLKDDNYNVDNATDGVEALEMIKKKGYDLILLDIMLPKVDGIQVLTKLKADLSTKLIPVIILTNFGQESLVKEAVNLGSTDYLLKYNITPGELAAKIKELFNG